MSLDPKEKAELLKYRSARALRPNDHIAEKATAEAGFKNEMKEITRFLNRHGIMNHGLSDACLYMKSTEFNHLLEQARQSLEVKGIFKQGNKLSSDANEADNNYHTWNKLSQDVWDHFMKYTKATEPARQAGIR